MMVESQNALNEFPQPVLMAGIALMQVQHLALGLVEPCEVNMDQVCRGPFGQAHLLCNILYFCTYTLICTWFALSWDNWQAMYLLPHLYSRPVNDGLGLWSPSQVDSSCAGACRMVSSVPYASAGLNAACIKQGAKPIPWRWELCMMTWMQIFLAGVSLSYFAGMHGYLCVQRSKLKEFDQPNKPTVLDVKCSLQCKGLCKVPNSKESVLNNVVKVGCLKSLCSKPSPVRKRLKLFLFVYLF